MNFLAFDLAFEKKAREREGMLASNRFEDEVRHGGLRLDPQPLRRRVNG